MDEKDARLLRDATIRKARSIISDVSRAFNSTRTKNPSTNVRAVFGLWANKAVMHLAAITVLAEEHDLSIVAYVHHRQMIEILIQVRYLAMANEKQREKIARKVIAWGCADYLEKISTFKDTDVGKAGYEVISRQFANFDRDVIDEISAERAKGQLYWFGRSPSKLAKIVSRGAEDLKRLYHLVSAQAHGIWDVALEVTNPKPGSLFFRPYPDRATLFRWSANLVDQTTYLLVQIWNEIADATGAQSIIIKTIGAK